MTVTEAGHIGLHYSFTKVSPISLKLVVFESFMAMCLRSM